jgi:hypothetical protein
MAQQDDIHIFQKRRVLYAVLGVMFLAFLGAVPVDIPARNMKRNLTRTASASSRATLSVDMCSTGIEDS